MKNYVDVKITVWQRHHFTDETDMQQIIEMIKVKGLDEVIDDAAGFTESEILFETQSDMTPEENERQSTIEVYRDETPLWNNELKS